MAPQPKRKKSKQIKVPKEVVQKIIDRARSNAAGPHPLPTAKGTRGEKKRRALDDQTD